MTSRRLSATIVLLVLFLAACGQFENVHETAVGVPGAAAGGAAGTAGGTAALPGLPGTTVPAGGAAPGTAGGATAPGTAGGGTAGGTAGGGSAGGGSQTSGAGTVKGDTTGVTATSITIGIHAPLTGAAPLRQASFNAGKELYWKYGNNGKPVTINGRSVKVVFQDDQYNPSHARLVCQQMAESQKAFLLIGGGGTDQIQACAQYSASRGIPYLSAGVTEIGMRSLKNYFALSMSYAQQSVLLAQYIKNVLKVTDAGKVAVVATNTANFDDAVDAFKKSFPGVNVFRPDKNERGSQRASSLCAGSVKLFDVVFPLTSPSYYLEMAGAAKCNPQYAGVGVTHGLDEVADLGCSAAGRGTEGARFFSPTPAYEDARQGKWDPQFLKAAQASGAAVDDIVWLLWGLSKDLHQLIQAVGPNLNRQSFMSVAENTKVHTNVFPDLEYTPQNHFGAKQVHVLKNVCQSRGQENGYYVTEAAFKSSF